MEKDWWLEFYTGEYVDVVLTTDTNDVIKFIISVTGIVAGEVVYDQCCGRGTVSAPLAKLGCKVYGCDMSDELIERAMADYGTLGCKYCVADGRLYRADEKANLGLNWNTSFAYSEDDADNRPMLAALFDNIKDGGQFLMSTLNPTYVLTHFQKFIVKEVPYQGSTIITIRESYIENGMLKSRWTIVYPDGHRIYRHGQTKMYSPEQLIAMLKDFGLETKLVYGDVYKNPCTSQTQHIILYGNKI